MKATGATSSWCKKQIIVERWTTAPNTPKKEKIMKKKTQGKRKKRNHIPMARKPTEMSKTKGLDTE